MGEAKRRKETPRGAIWSRILYLTLGSHHQIPIRAVHQNHHPWRLDWHWSLISDLGYDSVHRSQLRLVGNRGLDSVG